MAELRQYEHQSLSFRGNLILPRYLVQLGYTVILALVTNLARGESGPESLLSIASDLAFNANVKFEPIPQLALVTDVDHDGSTDYVLVGLGDDSVIITIVRHTDSTFRLSSQLIFSISSTEQMSICGWPRGWTIYPRSDRPLNALGQYPSGYEDCPECGEFLLIADGDCDPVTIFWNSITGDIDWWRT